MPTPASSDQAPQAEPPLHIGLTGNIASGKSTVSRLLAQYGATILDADVHAREAVRPGSPALESIRKRFGSEVVSADGSLDRDALRRVVFNDPVARDALNQIVHPAVRALRDNAFKAARTRGDRIIVSDIPLLFETGLEHEFDAIIFVDAPERVRLARLIAHRSLPEADARAMMSAQWPSAEKRARANFVINNGGSVEALTEQVAALWKELQTLANSRS